MHAYYQWVPFMLFLQGVMFYIPHYLWKTFEDKKMDKITSGLRGKTFNTDGRREGCEHLITYLWETRGMHKAYALKYVLHVSQSHIFMYVKHFLGILCATSSTL